MNDHKNRVADIFDRAAPQYGKKSCCFFNYFGKRLVELANVTANQNVLDVATGKGAVLFPLAQAVGPPGKVVGIDISKEMLKETVKEAKERNIDWADLQHMDAEHLSFPDNCFDFVFCGFALFFFPSLPLALSEFKRVLKPGGKLAVSTWGKKSELNAWICAETKKFSPKNSLAATPLWSEDELQIALNAASFGNIQIFEESKVFLHNTPEEWWDSLWAHGTRAVLELLSSDQKTRLREKAINKAKDYDKGHGVVEELQVFYGIAQKKEKI